MEDFDDGDEGDETKCEGNEWMCQREVAEKNRNLETKNGIRGNS